MVHPALRRHPEPDTGASSRGGLISLPRWLRLSATWSRGMGPGANRLRCGMLQTRSLWSRRGCLLLGLFCGLSSAPAWAANPKEPVTPLAQKAFFRPELYISSSHVALDDVLSQLANRDAWEAFQ